MVMFPLVEDLTPPKRGTLKNHLKINLAHFSRPLQLVPLSGLWFTLLARISAIYQWVLLSPFLKTNFPHDVWWNIAWLMAKFDFGTLRHPQVAFLGSDRGGIEIPTNSTKLSSAFIYLGLGLMIVLGWYYFTNEQNPWPHVTFHKVVKGGDSNGEFWLLKTSPLFPMSTCLRCFGKLW